MYSSARPFARLQPLSTALEDSEECLSHRPGNKSRKSGDAPFPPCVDLVSVK
jgi:hypothetical protein